MNTELGLYGSSLSDVAGILGVSATWINKVQQRTGLPKPIDGIRGLRCHFSQKEVDILKQVKTLRLLGASLSEIETFYTVKEVPYSVKKQFIEAVLKKADETIEEIKEFKKIFGK